MNYKVLAVVTFCCVYHLSFSQKKDDQEKEVKMILRKYTCTKCHSQSIRIIGPSFNAVAKKGYTKERLIELIMKPEPDNWPGYGTMPTIDSLKLSDVEKVAEWIERRR